MEDVAVVIGGYLCDEIGESKVIQEGKGKGRLRPECCCWKELDFEKLAAIIFTTFSDPFMANAEYNWNFMLAINVDNAHRSLNGLDDPVGWAFVAVVAKMEDMASFGRARWLKVSAGARSPRVDAMEREALVL